MLTVWGAFAIAIKPTIALFVFGFLTAARPARSHQRRKRTRRWLRGSPFSIPTSQCHPRKVRKTWHPVRRRIRLETRTWFRRHCYVIRRRRGRLETDVIDFSWDFPAAAAFYEVFKKVHDEGTSSPTREMCATTAAAAEGYFLELRARDPRTAARRRRSRLRIWYRQEPLRSHLSPVANHSQSDNGRQLRCNRSSFRCKMEVALKLCWCFPTPAFARWRSEKPAAAGRQWNEWWDSHTPRAQ